MHKHLLNSNILTHAQFLQVTLPFMLSTATQPLLGAVNTAIMGHMASESYIAAVALGVIFFNSLYWLFGFLRVATTSFTAQAHGRNDRPATALALLQPLLLACLIGLIMLAVYPWLFPAYVRFMNPTDAVIPLLTTYCHILIWAAPLTLANYVLLGWLMGRMCVRENVCVQVSMNLLNVLLSLLFVYGFSGDVAGVAWATLLAQLYGCAAGAYAVCRRRRVLEISPAVRRKLYSLRQYVGIMRVNSDLIIRTLCLLALNNLFARAGSLLGTDVLSANAVLLELVFIVAFLADGIANGVSVYTGAAFGRKDERLWARALKVGCDIAGGYIVLATAFLLFCGDALLPLFTDIPAVLAIAREHLWALCTYPVCAVLGLTLYGMYTGIGATASVRNMMLIAIPSFYALSQYLVPLLGNVGLWAAYVATYGLESVLLVLFLPQARAKFRPQ